MITDDDIHGFLEHHGVLGMRWGVRKTSETSNGSQKTGLSRNKKIAIVGISIVAVAAGAIMAKKVLSMHSTTSMRSVAESLPIHQNTSSVAHLFQSGKVPEPTEFTRLKLTRDSHKAELLKVLKPHEFIVWDEAAKNYAISTTHGWNPITNRFGIQTHN
jgi:hypothetical protein